MQYLFHLASYVGHWVCLFVFWGELCFEMVVSFLGGVMLGISFACLLVGGNYV